MNKIEQGIEISNQHIYNVINEIPEEFPFVEQILNLGFRDLEDFFNQKREYQMQQCLKGKVIDVLPKDTMNIVYQFINNISFGIASIETHETCVHSGISEDKSLNVEYCNQHNIPIYYHEAPGGSIVATEGDYTIILSTPKEIDLSANYFLYHFKLLLEKYFPNNITTDGNDIFLNNKKVVGITTMKTEKLFLFSATFSFSDKINLINNICGNSYEKVPGFINPNILPPKQLKEEVLTWLQGL